MPLFNVTSFGRKSKVLIRAETLQAVINSAKAKLNLSGETYQVALDEDGTVIDEDEILLEIAQLSRSAAKLIVLESHQIWQSPVDIAPTATVNAEPTEKPNQPTDNAASGHLDGTSGETSDCAQPILGTSLWAKFPPRLMKCCESGKIAYEADRRNLVSIIAEHMLYDLNDGSRKTAERFARAITEKYRATFSDTIGGKIVGDGMESFRQQIYTAVQYRKKDKEHKRRAQMQDSDNSDGGTPQVRVKKSTIHDEYGCVEYQPLLPSSETAASQNEKKTLLIDLCKKAEEDDKISGLMDDTYYSQRSDINNGKRDFEKLLKDWPYLFQQRYLVNHASRLLGKPVTEVWEKSLSENARPLRKYIAFTEKTKVIKSEKSKESGTDVSTESEVSALLSQAKEASKAAKSEVPMIAVIFPLIARHLKEDPGLLYKVIPEDVAIAEIKDYADNDYPQLLIRGKSLFDENAKCDVVLEKLMTINVGSVLDGFLITFVSYYVFGYVYKPALTKTLEFIQRGLLQINPPKGHKRGDKKRKATPCDASVMKLSRAVEAFKEE